MAKEEAAAVVARMCRRIRCILRRARANWLGNCLNAACQTFTYTLPLPHRPLPLVPLRCSRLHFHLLSSTGHLDWHMHSGIVTAFQIGSQLSFRMPRPLLNSSSLSVITFPLHTDSHFIFIILLPLSAGKLHNPFLHLEDFPFHF